MQQAEYDIDDFDSRQQSKADEKLLVKFYLKSVKNLVASSAEGRPMYREVEYIDIKIPGQRDSVARPASPRDKNRFPRHYEAFKQRVELPVDGTPLSEWAAVSRSMADQFAFENIKTVEQLADVADNLLHRVQGAGILKQKAKDWLEAAKGDSILSQLRDGLVERDETIEEQKGQIEQLFSRLEALESTKED